MVKIVLSIFIFYFINAGAIEVKQNSIFGDGFCLTTGILNSITKIGIKMCLKECVRNSNCRSVNYYKSVLFCELLSTDSENIADYHEDSRCSHYTVTQMNNTQICNGSECPSYHTCFTSSKDVDICIRTECPVPNVINGNLSRGEIHMGDQRNATCFYGYEIDGKITTTSMTCLTNGDWTGNPECRLLECPNPSAPENAIIYPGNITFGTIRYIECMPGYGRIGDNGNITCQINKLWTVWSGQCKLCNKPTVIANAVVSSGNVTVGSQRTYVCSSVDYESNNQSPIVTCQDDTTWSSTSFACSLKECPVPDMPPNVIVQSGSLTVHTTRDVSCATGYAKLGGEVSITCQINKTWTIWTGNCSLCSPPIEILNADLSSGDVKVGSQRTYTCLPGYEDNGGTDTIMCQNNATWSSTTFSCSAVECPEPTAPLNAIVGTGPNIYKSNRTISCMSGFLKIGSISHITCNSNKLWDDWSGICKDCGEPATIMNAVVSTGTKTIGSQRTYTCSIGYLDNGQTGTITCQADALWSMISFTCTPIVCPEPTPPPHAVLGGDSNTYNSTRTVNCLTGYAKIGGESVITCGLNQLWTTWTGTCSLCPLPNSIANALLSSGASTVGSQRTYTCKADYISNGKSGITTCQNNATWSYVAFACNLIDCGTPVSIPLASYSTNNSNKIYSVATYTCNYGYAGNGGKSTSTCSSSASWTTVSLTCSRPVSVTIGFESSDKYLFKTVSGYFSWSTGTGSTPSVNTGPVSAYQGSYYKYMETSSTNMNEKSRMMTDFYFSVNAHCLDFWYSMYGNDIGTLRVFYKVYGYSTTYQIFVSSGNKMTTNWYNKKVSINASGDFQLIFEASDGGTSFTGDIAVDYIRVYATCT